MERRSRDTGSRPGECGRQLHRLQVELAVDNTGNSIFAKSFGHCRELFVGPSAQNNFCREPRLAQQYSRHCHLCRGSGRQQAGTLDRIKSLLRASARQGRHRRRRNEHRHIWIAVHCADGSAVGPSAKTQPKNKKRITSLLRA
jgi:hypothetical protein